MHQELNYKHLYYFWVTAKEGGMSHAADRLGLAVQTVSAQVRLLEQSLGHALFKPAGRGLALTDAGQAALLDLRLSSERKTPRHGIGLGVLADGGLAHTHLGWADVAAQGSTPVQVAWAPPRRGVHPLPALTAVTLYPLGTFRVWTVWRPAAELLVYPAPEAHPPPLPPGQPQPGHTRQSARVQASGEFDGVRAYRRGDPQKNIVWKKAAQAFAAGRDDLVSRDALSTQRQQLWLDFAQTGTHEVEARLSRLTAWVLMADRLGLDYGLRLPGREMAPDQGPVHKARCLEALALC